MSIYYGKRPHNPLAGLTTRYLAQMIAAGSPDREAYLAEIARREAAKKRRAAADKPTYRDHDGARTMADVRDYWQPTIVSLEDPAELHNTLKTELGE